MTSKPLKKGKIVQHESGESWAVYEEDSDSLHQLNASARAIWELCDGTTTPEEMAYAISELTGLDEQESLAQVKTTLARLEASGLLVS